MTAPLSTPSLTSGLPRALTRVALLALLAGTGALAGCWPTETPPQDSGSVDLDGDGTTDGAGEDGSNDAAADGADGSGSGADAGDGASSSASDDADADGADSTDGSDDAAAGATDGSDGAGATGAASGSTTSGTRSGLSGNRSSSSGSTSSGSRSGSLSGNRSSSSGSTSSTRGPSGNRTTSSGSTSSGSTSSGSTSSTRGPSGNRTASSGDSSSSSSSSRGPSGNRSASTGGSGGSSSSDSTSSTRGPSGNRSSSGGSGGDSSADAMASTGGSDSGSAGGDDNDGISMGMDMPAVDDWETAPGVRRYSGEDWKSLREDRVITVMNEPGPGTDPSCYPRDVMPMAEKGKLTKDQVSCVQASLSQAEYDADKARLSLVLITNAHARMETDNWEWLVARHLETIDPENPGLSYRYALHMYEKGPQSYPEAYRWAGVALGQRAAWTGSVYHERVTRLYKLRSALSQAQWRSAEDAFSEDPSEDNRDDVLEWRENTRKAALEWYRYAKETEMDTTVAYKLCTIASIQEGCEGVDSPG